MDYITVIKDRFVVVGDKSQRGIHFSLHKDGKIEQLEYDNVIK
jgi:hypothetical protein